MGNTANMNNVPNDPTKCSKEQLQILINSVIIYDPWSQNNAEDQTDDDIFYTTVMLMRKKGFRPITPDEYLDELKRRREIDPDNLGNIKVWVPFDDDSLRVFCDDSNYDALSIDGKTAYDYKLNNQNESKQFQRQKEWEKNHPGDNEVRSFYTATTLTMESCDDDPHLKNKLSISLPSTAEDAAYIVEKSGYCYSNEDAAIISQHISGTSEASTEEWPHYSHVVRKQQQEYYSHKNQSNFK